MKGSGDVRSLQLALAIYVLIFAMKLAAYFATGVMALLAESMHTLSDIFVSGFLLAALIWSRKGADEVHMFGHGRAQNVAALVAATLFISFTSFELYKEAIPRLFRAEAATYQNLPLAVGVLVGSMLIAAMPLWKLLAQKVRGPAARTQLVGLIKDELGLATALLGTLFVMWGQPVADPIAAIVLATIIAYMGVMLFRENLGFLVGRSPGPEFLTKVEGLARSVPGVLGVHDLLAEYVGPDMIHAGMHINVQRGVLIEEADRIAEEVRERVEQVTGCRYCVVHVDPVETA